MDELMLLRELEGDAPPLSAETKNSALMRLRREISREQRTPVRRLRHRRPSILATGAIAALATVAAALTMFNTGGFDRPPGAIQTASAAVLRDAARHARAAAPVAYRDDQFLYSREIVEETPANGRGRKVTFVNQYWRSADGSKPSLVMEHGRMWEEAPFDDGSTWPPRRWEALEALPTDPRELTAAVLDRFGPSNTESVNHESAYTGLSMLIDRGQPLPPGLRAAALEAMASIPDVTVIDGLRAAGRGAVGVTRPPGHPTQPEDLILLDRETYDYLGTRSTFVGTDGVEIVQLRRLEETGVVDQIGERP